MLDQTSASQSSQLRTERRTWVRFPNNQAMAASTTDEKATGWLGRVKNISLGGIAFSIPRRRFEPGTELMIELATTAGKVYRLPVRVIHSMSEMNGRWIVGCAFATPLAPDDLKKLLHHGTSWPVFLG